MNRAAACVVAALMLLMGPILPSLAAPPVVARSAVAGPTLRFTGYVVDQAGVLTPQERRRITRIAADFQRSSGHQLAVATVDDLRGEDVAAFATRLGTRWGVGRKGLDDGILIVLAPSDRAARIAVGRGLERRLPDAVCRRVMSGIMTPAFARGQFGRGIEAGVVALIHRLSLSHASHRP